MKSITVLSLFDGMSCGQIALERAGIPVQKYYASEIDKWAMQITKRNYPNTNHLGDIKNWKSWDIDIPDLIIAGSPCQGFSTAGQGLNFEDPRSKLFFVFVDILRHYQALNPNLKFMLENVKMKKVWAEIITKKMGVDPVLINSALVSAQNRQRLYWTNFPIPQPEDKGIFLKDIVECGEVDREKSYTIDANYFKGGNPRSYFEDGRRQLVFEHQSHKRAMVRTDGCIQVGNIYPSGGISGRIYSVEGKSPSLRTPTGGNHMPKISTAPVMFTEARTEEAKELRKKHRQENGKDWSPRRGKELVPRKDDKSNCLTGNLSKEHNLVDGSGYRKLTVLECERLQTVPEGYTEGVSNTQRYKMLGNGWTVDVISHIFSHMELE